MATLTAASLMERLEKKGVPKSKRKLQKHLRSAGLAYISRTGKLIPAKTVADELCQCPHKCDELVPYEARDHLFQHFYGLGDADLQNQFLRCNMDLRARLNVPESTGTGRAPRRITCKYLVPLLNEGKSVEVCQKAFVSAFVITTKRVRLQREKLIASLGLNSYSSHNRSKDKDKAKELLAQQLLLENNNNTITLTPTSKLLSHLPMDLSVTVPISSRCSDAKRPTYSPEPKMPEITITKKLFKPASKRQVNNPLIPVGLMVPDSVTIKPVIATPDHDRDIAIVHNFFSNQLWKPEYIGAYS